MSSARLGSILRHLTPATPSPSILDPSPCNSELNDLDRERQNATFPVDDLMHYLDGGARYSQFKQIVCAQIENDPVLFDPDRADFTRAQHRERTMMKIRRTIEMWRDIRATATNETGKKAKEGSRNSSVSDAFWEMLSLYDPSWATRLGVHVGLFSATISGQGTPEQVAKYEEDAFNMKIIGCFAMTEMGHGSNVQGLETTSTYDKKTQEFIVNSPTVTSTKWWIGGAGQMATHCVAFARLIIDGKEHGIHVFLVQLRDKDGHPVEGITVGDCGAKMGRNGLDNGFIQFHNKRIPRENMLMKWAQVSADGIYTKPPRAEMVYGTLIGGRVGMIKGASDYMKKALCIAIRYSSVRRQFQGIQKEGQESQLIDYQSHQQRLFPLLANSVAVHFAALGVSSQFEKLQEELADKDISSLPEIHATSAGLKAFCTWWAHGGIESCRQCLGGHGYSSYSHLSSLSADYAVMCTWEGDNMVLAQQLARFLVGQLKNVKGNKPAVGFTKYLDNFQTTLKRKFTGSSMQDLDFDAQWEAHRHIATKLILFASQELISKSHLPKASAWNACLVDLVAAAKAHCNFVLVHSFMEAIKAAPESTKPILSILCSLSSLTFLQENMSVLLASGHFQSNHVLMIHQEIKRLYSLIRNEAVALTDAFNLPDLVINTPFGREDGNIYENYFEMVKSSPGCMEKAPYWDTVIKPMLEWEPQA